MRERSRADFCANRYAVANFRANADRRPIANRRPYGDLRAVANRRPYGDLRAVAGRRAQRRRDREGRRPRVRSLSRNA